ncbi:MAG: recombinase family protein [Alphaproteobacteria bacterium]|nr:recombinase family protein [Alphaproteobacteria bacterium]
MRFLRGLIYTGDFEWNGKRYRGTHDPLISRELWKAVQEILTTGRPGEERSANMTLLFPASSSAAIQVALSWEI